MHDFCKRLRRWIRIQSCTFPIDAVIRASTLDGLERRWRGEVRIIPEPPKISQTVPACLGQQLDSRFEFPHCRIGRSGIVPGVVRVKIGFSMQRRIDERLRACVLSLSGQEECLAARQ